MVSLDEIETAQKPADQVSKGRPRPKPKKKGLGRPRKSEEIPVFGAEIPDDGEPRVKIDYEKMQYAIDQWLALVAEIPCRLLKVAPLLPDERLAVVSSGKNALEYYFPDTAHPGMVFLATCGTVYGGKLIEKQMAMREARRNAGVPQNVPPPDRREDGQRQDGPVEEAIAG